MLCAVLALGVLTTFAVLFGERKVQDRGLALEKPVESVVYRSIKGPRGMRCVLAARTDGAAHFQAFAMGFEQMRVSFEAEDFWFWMPSYSNTHFFFCPIREIERMGLSPMFRPSFIMCVSGLSSLAGSSTRTGTVEFHDGEYEVVRTFEGNLLKEQVYSYDGIKALTVLIKERQEISGVSFPKSISLDMHDGSGPSEFHMGEPDINPSGFPVLKPPEGKKACRLERIR